MEQATWAASIQELYALDKNLVISVNLMLSDFIKYKQPKDFISTKKMAAAKKCKLKLKI